MTPAGKTLFLQKILANAISGHTSEKKHCPPYSWRLERRSRDDQIIEARTPATEVFLQKVAAASGQRGLKAKKLKHFRRCSTTAAAVISGLIDVRIRGASPS